MIDNHAISHLNNQYMDANNPNLSEKDRNSILNHIINCANAALQSEDSFQKAMLGLAAELRIIFDSKYCSIGTVVNGIVEDCFLDYEKKDDELMASEQANNLKSVQSANINDDNTTVSIALKSPKDISIFYPNDFINLKNYDCYHLILDCDIFNSIVIPIRDYSYHNIGFIQLINSNINIDYRTDILPFKDALVGLIQIILNNQQHQYDYEKQKKRLRDFDFYHEVQDNKDNIEKLLDRIMEYFSEEFNAAVISFRIPVLSDLQSKPLFYLRRCFVHKSIEAGKRNNLIDKYNKEWFARDQVSMGGYDRFRCSNKGRILESVSKTDFKKYGFDLHERTLIMPIFCNFNENCINKKRINLNNKICKDVENIDCTERFKRLYGIFRLRISKIDLSNNEREYFFDLEETVHRLSYLSKQITLLIDSIVNKYETESLQKFQEELKNSSFVNIKAFDERCVNIIKKSVNAKICSIYRLYEDDSQQKKFLQLSATTLKEKIKLSTDTLDNYSIPVDDINNSLARVYRQKSSEYSFKYLPNSFIETHSQSNKLYSQNDSDLIVPMLKKDGTCIGVVLLIGKTGNKHSISTTYWEHDIKHIEFIVSVLSRITESDTERLTFLSQLSHELLRPITELVYDSDFTVSAALRNIQTITKKSLIKKLEENIDRNFLFKYIIDDIEYTYSSSERGIEYNIELQNEPQEELLDAVRLMEHEAHSAEHNLQIRTNINNMPPMYFDRERMKQVFINLLKNAIRYSNERTIINIYYKYNDNTNEHEIRFANYGIGICETEKDSIFDLFHRGREAQKRFKRGTGMGLYIVRNIMKAHGGNCFVRNLNNPTEFVITLPNKL